MTLRAKSPKKAEPKKPKILIYGAPGVGKTWGAIDFPGCYLIDCEGGAALDHYTDKLEAAGGSYLGPEDGANDFDVVLDEIRQLATTKHSYRTLVIDSYSKLFNTRVAEKTEVMEKNNVDMDKTFGREKKPAINSSRHLVAWLGKLDMNVLLICHEKGVWDNGKVIGTTFDGWDRLEYELDLVMRIVKQGTSRKAVVGKCRLSQFKSGESIDWNYDTFAERYGLEVMEAAASHVAPSTAEQVTLVQQLAAAVKLDDDTREKWFEKAGVDSWAEMDAPTIQACLDYLKKSLPSSAA